MKYLNYTIRNDTKSVLIKQTNFIGAEKTRWVRFVDDVNEKLSEVQEICLTIYNGFYCISEILNTIFYCCENVNRKLFSGDKQIRKRTNETNSSVSLSNMSDAENLSDKQNFNSIDKLQVDYTKNVVTKMETVRKLLGQLSPLNYRLEVLENIYSLIYLTSHDLHETEEQYSDEDDDDQLQNQTLSNVYGRNRTISLIENEKNSTDLEGMNVTESRYSENNEFSIYNTVDELKASNLLKPGHRNSKEILGSSRGSLNSHKYSFSVNSKWFFL